MPSLSELYCPGTLSDIHRQYDCLQDLNERALLSDGIDYSTEIYDFPVKPSSTLRFVP